MRLVIEREGGFSIVEDADAITEIDVQSHAVVLTIEVGGDKWTTKLPVSSHAEACRVSAAIAVKCGELVEPLAKGPAPGKASGWVEGFPPKGFDWWVVDFGGAPVCVRWNNQMDGFIDGSGLVVYDNATPRYLPTPIPPFSGAEGRA